MRSVTRRSKRASGTRKVKKQRGGIPVDVEKEQMQLQMQLLMPRRQEHEEKQEQMQLLMPRQKTPASQQKQKAAPVSAVKLISANNWAAAVKLASASAVKQVPVAAVASALQQVPVAEAPAPKPQAGKQVDIRQKPIVLMFFHGGCEINKVCEAGGVYELDKNMQLMVLAHPGESLSVGHKLKTIAQVNNFRYRTFEPLFDMHSISDLNKKNASYYNLDAANLNALNPPFFTPFTNEGKSIFETPLRAKEGSVVPNTLFTLETKKLLVTDFPKFGLYIYYPDKLRVVEYIPPGAIKKGANFLHLSDVAEFLKKSKYYNEDVGLGLIQVSCNSLYKDYKSKVKTFIMKGNLTRNKNLSKKCHAIEEFYQTANTEYNSLELLSSQELKSKYGPEPIFIPIISKQARKESDELLEMMKI
jgi:hypothetical protein